MGLLYNFSGQICGNPELEEFKQIYRITGWWFGTCFISSIYWE